MVQLRALMGWFSSNHPLSSGRRLSMHTSDQARCLETTERYSDGLHTAARHVFFGPFKIPSRHVTCRLSATALFLELHSIARPARGCGLHQDKVTSFGPQDLPKMFTACQLLSCVRITALRSVLDDKPSTSSAMDQLCMRLCVSCICLAAGPDCARCYDSSNAVHPARSI